MTTRFWWMSFASLAFVIGCDGTPPAPDAGPDVAGQVAEGAGGAARGGNAGGDVTRDPANCGACGNAGGAGEACVGGACGGVGMARTDVWPERKARAAGEEVAGV